MIYSLLKDRKTCEVCKKSFSNACALGSHMRSHTVPALETSNKVGPNIKPNETVLIRSNHTSEVGDGAKPEEGAEQIKGKRKMVEEVDYTKSLTVVEEAALCLVAMSKGQRPANSQNWNAIDRFLEGEEEYSGSETDSDSDDDEEEVKYRSVAELTSNKETLIEDNDEETYLVARDRKCKKKFICDICGKVFCSYQALGGHRTSHKRKRVKIQEKTDQDVVRCFKCEFCGREFESGQALGGHKKVHMQRVTK